jgi:hypothetical protein
MVEINDIRVEKTNFRGKDYVSIRKWYDDNGTAKPGKNGINMTMEEWELFVNKFEEIKNEVKNAE